jgi:hypothetical protein
MHCYYPDEFEQVVLDRGFEIIEQWCGQKGERYGQGPESAIQFKSTSYPYAEVELSRLTERQ